MGTINGHYQLLTVHPKGYSLLLALCMRISPSQYMHIVHLLMIFCDSLVCILLDKICCSTFRSEKTGILAAFFWAVNPLAILNVNQDYPDAFSGFLTAVVIMLYFREYQSETRRYVMLGIMCAIAAYFRSEFTAVPMIILLCDMIRKKNVLSTFAKWLVLLVSFLVIMSPWIIYSGIKSGHPMLTSQNGWGAAYSAIGENPANSFGIQTGDQYVNEEALEHGFDSAWTYDANMYFKGRFLSYIRQYPKEYAYLVLHYRIGRAFLPNSYVIFNLNLPYNGFSIHDYCRSYGSLCTYSFAYYFSFEGRNGRLLSGILLVMMLLFIAEAFRKKKFSKYSFLIAVWLYFPLVISLLKQVEPRNVLPAMTASVIAGAYIVDRPVEWLFRKLKK